MFWLADAASVVGSLDMSVWLWWMCITSHAHLACGFSWTDGEQTDPDGRWNQKFPHEGQSGKLSTDLKTCWQFQTKPLCSGIPARKPVPATKFGRVHLPLLVGSLLAAKRQRKLSEKVLGFFGYILCVCVWALCGVGVYVCCVWVCARMGVCIFL